MAQLTCRELEDPELVRELSVCISQRLSRLGYGKHKSELMSAEVRLKEHIEYRETGTEIHSTGSNTEGVDISGSDRDNAIVVSGVYVIPSMEYLCRVPSDCHVCLLDQDGTRPCYTRLILIKEQVSETIWFRRLGGIRNMCVEKEGKLYLSSALFVQQAAKDVRDELPSSDDHTIDDVHPHGPCATFSNRVGDRDFDTDFAFCLPCVSLPHQCLSWFTRKRNQWPPDQMLSRMRQEKCHLVPVGNKVSPTSNLEWRISYSPIERQLVWSLNDTQIKCYVIMKSILKQMIAPKVADLLTSFNIKTLIFWVVETSEEDLWHAENLIECVRVCLRQMLQYVENLNVPHYIVPENNLLLHKVESFTEQQVVANVIKDLLNKDCTWIEIGRDVQKFLDATKEPPYMKLFYDDRLYLKTIQRVYTEMHMFSMDIQFYKRKLNIVSSSDADVGFGLTGFLQKSIRERIWFMSGTLAANRGRLASFADVSSGRLYLATALLLSNDHQGAYSVLTTLLKLFDCHVIYDGICGPNECMPIDYICHLGSQGEEITDEKKVQTYFALDVAFSKYDSVPQVLKYEQTLWQEEEVPIYVHPRLYLRFLLFLVLKSLQREQEADGCLISLEQDVEETTETGHIFANVAWNLLGWCFNVQGETNKALACFSQSLQSRSKKNAAAYHIAIMALAQ